jgi:hypothetical protein
MKPLLALLGISLVAPAFAQTNTANLRDAFRQAEVGSPPLGYYRGTVVAAEGLFPRVKALLQGAVWKGKTFHGDGTFTNHWLGGIQAVSTGTGYGASVIDGRPAVVMRYRRSQPVFGGDYDEMRELTPGVWLGRRFDAATGKPKNWFLLEAR